MKKGKGAYSDDGEDGDDDNKKYCNNVLEEVEWSYK